MNDYNKDNPLLICECGRKFRKYGFNRAGEQRTYTGCMNCFMEDLAEQTSKYKEGYASMKDATESDDFFRDEGAGVDAGLEKY